MATPLIKDNPARTERDGTILAERMAGKTYSDISQSTGVPKTTISRVLNSAEIKARIEAAQQELIDGSLATVISNQLRKIELSRQILTGDNQDNTIPTVKDKDILELADKAETRIMQSVGIAPSHTTATVFQQIFNSNMAVISPQVLDMLRQRDTGPVLDIEPDLPDIDSPDLESGGDSQR